jgi:hypothetical protein
MRNKASCSLRTSVAKQKKFPAHPSVPLLPSQTDREREMPWNRLSRSKKSAADKNELSPRSRVQTSATSVQSDPKRQRSELPHQAPLVVTIDDDVPVWELLDQRKSPRHSPAPSPAASPARPFGRQLTAPSPPIGQAIEASDAPVWSLIEDKPVQRHKSPLLDSRRLDVGSANTTRPHAASSSLTVRLPPFWFSYFSLGLHLSYWQFCGLRSRTHTH